jgi:hypothetical protein
MILLWISVSTSHTADMLEPTKLYATRLQSVIAPKQIQEESAKKLGATISSTFIYVVLLYDGKLIWISPKQKLIVNQTKFEWPNNPDCTAALLWDRDKHITVRVFLSDNKVEAIGSSAAIGGVGGAGVGAVIGAILAGAFTAGTAAPAGAVIGGLIGGSMGGVAGGATGALSANDRILFEVDCYGKNNFPLDGSVDYKVKSLGVEHTASVTFGLLDSKAGAQQGSLELGEKYVVWLRAIQLSTKAASKGEKKTDKANYYVDFHQGPNKYPFYKDNPISITPDIVMNPEIFTVLKNTGESTQIQVYEKDLIRDDLVFSSTIGKIDGKSWVFIRKASADDVNDNSYVDFETFGPLK